MKFALFCVTILVLACDNESDNYKTPLYPDSTTASRTITDSSWGVITESTNYEEIKNYFEPSHNFLEDTFCNSECRDSALATIIREGTDEEIVVYWEDSAYHQKIALVRTGSEKRTYKTASGLGVGTPLRELLRQNGKKISFNAFWGDEAGYIYSFNGGALANSRIHWALNIPFDTMVAMRKDSISGGLWDENKRFDSEDPIIQRFMDKIFVYQVSLPFSKSKDYKIPIRPGLLISTRNWSEDSIQ